MSRDRFEHRAAKVSLVTGLTSVLSIGFQLISVPICLKFWGKETYGSWLALYAAFMIVRSLDSGYISYVGNKINYLYNKDHDALRIHLSSSIFGIAVISFIQLSIGLAALCFDTVANWFGLAIAGNHAELALLVLIITWILSGSYLGIVHRLFIPTGYMYQAAWWAMGLQVIQFFGIILAATTHLTMLQTSLVFAFTQFSVYLLSAIYIRLKLPVYYPWWSGANVRTGLKDLGQSMLLTVSNLIQQGTTNGTVMLLSILSGPMVVPVFTTVRSLTNLWTTVTSVLTTPLLPDVVRYHATGEMRKVVSICKAYWVLIGSIVNFGVLITYPAIKPLYRYWTAHVVVLDRSLLCLLLASVVVANVGGLVAIYLNGINRLGIVLVASAGRGVLSLVLGGFLFASFGLAGFGMGILGGELVALFVQVYFFIRYELIQHNVDLSTKSIAPITVSTVSVLMFLVVESFGYMHAQYIYSVAIMGVATSLMWGWRGLDLDVRTRFVKLIGGRFL